MKDSEKILDKQQENSCLTQKSLKHQSVKSKISNEHTINDTKYRIVEEWECEDAYFDYVVEKFR